MASQVNMTKSERYTKVLSKYLPAEYVPMVIELLLKHPVVFKIVKPRKSKLGDFRGRNSKGKMQITINSDLNKYSFLITTLHEFAHLVTFVEHGHRVVPHGVEWQNNYRKLILPAIDLKHLPDKLEAVLMNSLINVKASSCTDQKLNRVMMEFDQKEDDLILLEDLDKNAIFTISSKRFVKGELRRTRYLCQEVGSGKNYLVNALARVKKE